jgi:hypothetical protein
MPRKLSKTGWKRSKYTRLKNLTVQFWLVKALLAKKIQNWIFKNSIEIL